MFSQCLKVPILNEEIQLFSSVKHSHRTVWCSWWLNSPYPEEVVNATKSFVAGPLEMGELGVTGSFMYTDISSCFHEIEEENM
jgi:hypothetical protein